MRVLRAVLCVVSLAGLAACAGTNAATDSAAPAVTAGPAPDLSQPATGVPLGAPNAAPAASESAPRTASRPATQQGRRPQAGFRGGAQVAAPAEAPDEPELTPEQQVYKFKGQCWMETEKQRTSDVDKRIALVDKCVAAKMKGVKAN